MYEIIFQGKVQNQISWKNKSIFIAKLLKLYQIERTLNFIKSFIKPICVSILTLNFIICAFSLDFFRWKSSSNIFSCMFIELG